MKFGMVKTFDPAGWGWDRPVAALVKVSSRGLVGNDRRDFLKMAGDGQAAHVFADALDQIKIAKDEVPIHMIAVGSTEKYGLNRNGDGFTEAACRKYHDTFKKYAKVYRSHRNKPPSPSYGVVKASAYNDEMSRIELLCALNSTKEAADRNGGLIADQELTKLAREQDFDVSMSCSVGYDQCNSCDNKARTRAEYCTGIHQGGQCKHGGCRDNLTKVSDDGHVLGVDNPHPHFFDLSHVFRGADRTAKATGADWLNKAAADGYIMGGAELSEQLGIIAPMQVKLAAYAGPNATPLTKLAAGLAILEESSDGFGLPSHLRSSLSPLMRPPLRDVELKSLGRPGTEKAAETLGVLADYGIVLSFGDWARWHGHTDVTSTALSDVHGRLLTAGNVQEKIAGDTMLSKLAAAPQWQTASGRSASLATALYPTHSLNSAAASERAMRAVIRGVAEPSFNASIKQAAVTPQVQALADSYGLYQVAALHRRAGGTMADFELTARLVVAQNRL